MKYEVKRRFKLKPANKRYRRGNIRDPEWFFSRAVENSRLVGQTISEPKAVPKIESKPVQVVQIEPVSLGRVVSTAGWAQSTQVAIEDSDDAT